MARLNGGRFNSGRFQGGRFDRGGGVDPGLPRIPTTIVGTSAGVAAANSISIPAPAGHAAGDRLWFIIYTANVTPTPDGTVTTRGFQGGGTAGTNAAALCSTYEREATSAVEVNAVFTIPVVGATDHLYGFCVAERGCPTGGSAVIGSAALGGAETVNPILLPSPTTTINNVRMFQAVARPNNSVGPDFSGEVQPGGTGLTKLHDGGTLIGGNGGGLALFTWVDVSAGANVSTQITAVTPALRFERYTWMTNPAPF